MKPLLFPICFLTFFSLAKAQSHFRFSRLLFPDSAVAYGGIENKIDLVGIDSSTSIEIKALHGHIFQLDNRTGFLYKPSFALLDTLILYENDQEKERITVRRKTIPTPQILLAGNVPGKISRNILLAAPYFVIVYKGFLLNMYDYIGAVNASLKYGEEELSMRAMGNFISPQLIEIIAEYPHRMTLDCQVHFLGGISGCGRSVSLRYEIF